MSSKKSFVESERVREIESESERERESERVGARERGRREEEGRKEEGRRRARKTRTPHFGCVEKRQLMWGSLDRIIF